jgi:hypothetical protein
MDILSGQFDFISAYLTQTCVETASIINYDKENYVVDYYT